ncbi:hypothetical protein [Enterococcus sp. LJL51]|uniref:hypothetical protein n=1 Tax=Enterococcus sp. LJL51 TaxID=3416656 RepID=UPI003CF86670
MNDVNDIEELYPLLRKQLEDYVITGDVIERLSFLYSQCLDNTSQFAWYLGGPLFWIIHWRAVKKTDKKIGICSTERKIIHILQEYEAQFEKGVTILIRREA